MEVVRREYLQTSALIVIVPLFNTDSYITRRLSCKKPTHYLGTPGKNYNITVINTTV